MPINWEIFKNNLLTYFNQNVNSQDTGDKLNQVASKITDEYELAVKNGGDLNYNNMVISYTKPGLQTNIEQAFRQGFNSSNQEVVSQIFGNFFSLGLIQFWTGAQLVLLIPPPGAVTVISNVVTNPGTMISILSVQNTENDTEFIDNMIDFFKQHLQTLAGLTTALVPTPGGPVPTPVPWIGYC